MPIVRRDFLAASAAALAAGAGPTPPRIKVGQIGVGHAHASKLAVYRAVRRTTRWWASWNRTKPNRGRSARGHRPAFKRREVADPRATPRHVPGLQAVLVETRVARIARQRRGVRGGRDCTSTSTSRPASRCRTFARILDAATKQKLLVQMGYMYRYNPGVVRLRQFLRDGWLGDVFEVHAVMSKVVPPAARRDLAAYPGGILFELGCHLIDLVVGVLGKPATVTSHARQSLAIDTLQDNMLAVFDYPKAVATVKSSAVEVDGGARRHLVVCGTEGTFHLQPLDNPAAKVALSKPRGAYKKGYQDVSFPRYERYVADAADMARVIRSEKPSDFPPAHDLAVQEALLRACGLPA